MQESSLKSSLLNILKKTSEKVSLCSSVHNMYNPEFSN